MLDSPAQSASAPMRRKRNVDQVNDLNSFDPIQDLERSKTNLKRFIIDENQNDLNLLHELEEELDFSRPDKRKESFLSSDRVKGEDKVVSSEREDTKTSPERLKLAKVIKLLIIDSLKVGLDDAKEIAAAAVDEVDPSEVLLSWENEKHFRRKRSVTDRSEKRKLQSKILSHILQEIEYLKSLSRSDEVTSNYASPENKWYKIETDPGAVESVQASAKPTLDPEDLMESSLVDEVTSLLSQSAVDDFLGVARPDPSLTQVCCRIPRCEGCEGDRRRPAQCAHGHDCVEDRRVRGG